MTQQKARVTRILDAGRAEVSVHRQSACSHDCASCGGGCSELMVQSDVAVVAENLVHAAVGDTVTVETSTKGVLGAAVLVYLVPFFLFFTGYLLTSTIAGQGLSLAIGGFGFVFGFFLAWLLDRHLRKNRGFVFRITSIEQALECSAM